jgi:hypothetical protein
MTCGESTSGRSVTDQGPIGVNPAASKKLIRQPSSELHRQLREYRWVYTVFTQIGGAAKNKVKLIQSILSKRGEAIGGSINEPDNLKHPVPEDIAVTDHALVRYLERFRGINMAEVEAEMRERIRSGERYYGGAVVVDGDGNSYILRDEKLVVSMMPHEWLDDAAGVRAQVAFTRNRRAIKDETFRALAAAGVDTSPEALSKKISPSR